MCLNKNVNLEVENQHPVVSNVFTTQDYHVVRRAILKLREDEQSVVILRFWEHRTLEEIGIALDLNWRQVEKLMTSAFSNLKLICLNNETFSRFSTQENAHWNQARKTLIFPEPLPTAA